MLSPGVGRLVWCVQCCQTPIGRLQLIDMKHDVPYTQVFMYRVHFTIHFVWRSNGFSDLVVSFV